jgi:hypothetical protein
MRSWWLTAARRAILLAMAKTSSDSVPVVVTVAATAASLVAGIFLGRTLLAPNPKMPAAGRLLPAGAPGDGGGGGGGPGPGSGSRPRRRVGPGTFFTFRRSYPYAWFVDTPTVRYYERLPRYHSTARDLLAAMGLSCRDWRRMDDEDKEDAVRSIGLAPLIPLLYPDGYGSPYRWRSGALVQTGPRVVGTSNLGQPIVSLAPDYVWTNFRPTWTSVLNVPETLDWPELAVLVIDRYCARRTGYLPAIF